MYTGGEPPFCCLESEGEWGQHQEWGRRSRSRKRRCCSGCRWSAGGPLPSPRAFCPPPDPQSTAMPRTCAGAEGLSRACGKARGQSCSLCGELVWERVGAFPEEVAFVLCFETWGGGHPRHRSSHQKQHRGLSVLRGPSLALGSASLGRSIPDHLSVLHMLGNDEKS